MGLNAEEPYGPQEPITNPYAGYGFIVAGPEFVGRTTAISSIRNRTFTSLETASVSIVGPPRVGKSSLARHVQDQLATGRSVRGLTFVPVWITVSGCDSEQSLFRELAYAIQTWMSDRDLHTDRLEPLYESLSGAVSWDDMRMRMRTYLRRLRWLQYQVVAVLDEFDAARNVFRRSAPYEFLRALAYEPDVRVALITTSRRGLAEIVVRSTPELSTFPQIFGLPITLGGFDARELAALIARSPHIGADLADPLSAWLSRETGGQPFLASALLAVLHDRWVNDGVPPPAELPHHLGEAVTACSELTVLHHEQMLELLRDEDRLHTLLEVLFGPQVTAQPQDAERLAKEGIIRPTADGWTGFSENFQEYLGLLERRSDDWSFWQLTETGYEPPDHRAAGRVRRSVAGQAQGVPEADDPRVRESAGASTTGLPGTRSGREPARLRLPAGSAGRHHAALGATAANPGPIEGRLAGTAGADRAGPHTYGAQPALRDLSPAHGAVPRVLPGPAALAPATDGSGAVRRALRAGPRSGR